ncbi:VOC family protein [Draconibacterium sediminis]|uniref:VOC family protein n=1 Tax=Draconibacterium sediminis TaxID=1544798 RepID=UPI0006974935|nr:glyoxalase/bleomycin resistance/dioxygenase family protein [Draconibacterium sediminis]
MNMLRKEHELPQALVEWGWKYHHLGIPTNEKMPGEKYLPQFKFFHSGFPTSPFGVEWMRFEKDSPIHPLIQKVPHLAFEVENLDCELTTRNLKVITPPNPPMEGIRVAMIEHNGAPVELIEFEKK